MRREEKEGEEKEEEGGGGRRRGAREGRGVGGVAEGEATTG